LPTRTAAPAGTTASWLGAFSKNKD
jgi:hypothetical protein